jgi:hypothetical protein
MHVSDRVADSVFEQLIEESQDPHSDAMEAATATRPEVVDHAADNRSSRTDHDDGTWAFKAKVRSSEIAQETP